LWYREKRRGTVKYVLLFIMWIFWSVIDFWTTAWVVLSRAKQFSLHAVRFYGVLVTARPLSKSKVSGCIRKLTIKDEKLNKRSRVENRAQYSRTIRYIPLVLSKYLRFPYITNEGLRGDARKRYDRREPGSHKIIIRIKKDPPIKRASTKVTNSLPP